MTTEVNQLRLREVLNEQFNQKRMKNPSYSIRAFSQRLGVNHSALSEIINGKRKVGFKLAHRIAHSLMLEESTLKDLFQCEKVTPDREATILAADQYRTISDWYHFAILSLAETQPFKSDAAWIARRLGITKTQAQDAIERLVRLELIKIEKSKLVLTGKSFSGPDHVVDLGIRKTHHQYLEMAQESLEKVALERRDFTAMTMAIDPKKLPEAKRRIRAFRDELCAYLESGEKKEVFELCLQLFPLTKEVQS